MTLRPPRKVESRLWRKTPFDALEYEIGQEQAATLGRLGRRLEDALAALAAFDADTEDAALSAERRERRAALVDEAGEALWHFIVQREVLGLRDSARVLRDYGVPDEVRHRMGVVRPSRG